jgi:hypothetical protein
LRAGDEAEVKALTDGDPTVRSGLGFRYEFLPMISAVITTGTKQRRPSCLIAREASFCR